MGFLPWEIWLAFSGESQLQQSHATHPTVHAGCFSVSKIHQTLTWTTGSLTCAQMLMHATAHKGLWTHVRESALKVDSGRKIPCCTAESNLHQQHDGPMLWPTELNPHLCISSNLSVIISMQDQILLQYILGSKHEELILHAFRAANLDFLLFSSWYFMSLEVIETINRKMVWISEPQVRLSSS